MAFSEAMQRLFPLLSTASIFCLMAGSAFAYGSVRSPYVTKDEFAIELESKRSGDDEKKFNNAQSHNIEFGYGLTDHLKLEIEGDWKRESGEALFFDTGTIAARYALAKRGEHPIDTALYAAYGVTEDRHDPQSLTFGLLAQKQFGRLIHRANLFLEREVGANRESGVGLETRYLGMYDYHDYFRPGIEWQAIWGNTPNLKGWSDQGQHLGPAAYGKIPLPLWEGHGLQYEISHLWGISDGAPGSAARLKLEYTIQF